MKTIKKFNHGNNIFSPFANDERPVLIYSSCNSEYAHPLVSAPKAVVAHV